MAVYLLKGLQLKNKYFLSFYALIVVDCLTCVHVLLSFPPCVNTLKSIPSPDTVFIVPRVGLSQFRTCKILLLYFIINSDIIQ